MMLKTRPVFAKWLLATGFLLSVLTVAPDASAFPPIFEADEGGLELKMAAGFERWHAAPPPFPIVDIADGQGWFYQCNLRLLDINYIIPLMGYRAIDIEVERWGDDPRFSAVFVRNAGAFEAATFVVTGEEEDIRDMLFGGQLQNYRMVDLEVHQYKPSQPEGKQKNSPDEVIVLSTEIAALLVGNEGNQATPEWDFIVHASPIEIAIWNDTFTDQMRVIDQEISLDAPIEKASLGENLTHVLYSQIVVYNEGIEHVETQAFQYSTPLELSLLQADGWQLIDSERNIPLMWQHFPEFHGTFTGIFVQKPNQFEFHNNVNGYSEEMHWTTEDKRMIDLELVPLRNNAGWKLDETYLIYQ